MSRSRSCPWTSEMTVSISSELEVTDVTPCCDKMSRPVNLCRWLWDEDTTTSLLTLLTHLNMATMSCVLRTSSPVRWWYLVIPTLLRAFSNWQHIFVEVMIYFYNEQWSLFSNWIKIFYDAMKYFCNDHHSQTEWDISELYIPTWLIWCVLDTLRMAPAVSLSRAAVLLLVRRM